MDDLANRFAREMADAEPPPMPLFIAVIATSETSGLRSAAITASARNAAFPSFTFTVAGALPYALSHR